MRDEEARRREGEEAKRRRGGARFSLLNLVAYLLLTAIGLTMLVPFAWMVSTSLKAPAYAVEFPPRWIPSEPETVQIAGQECKVATWSSQATRVAILRYSLATLMVPAIVIMLPVYALLSNLRLTNTYAALIFPPMFSAYGTFLLRQFFMTIPRELEDAAVIDGASPFAVYRHIILPLSKPALATLTTFVFLHSWNDFLWPLMVVDRLALKTLPIGLAHFQDSYTTEYHLLMAASVIVMIPVLLVFLIGQRYFVRGIALSGMKG